LPPDLLSLADYARLARDHIEPPVLAWLEGGSGGEQVEGRLGEERNESRKNILLHRWRWAASLAAAGTRG
jgi:hypothetical protein